MNESSVQDKAIKEIKGGGEVCVMRGFSSWSSSLLKRLPKAATKISDAIFGLPDKVDCCCCWLYVVGCLLLIAKTWFLMTYVWSYSKPSSVQFSLETALLWIIIEMRNDESKQIEYQISNISKNSLFTTFNKKTHSIYNF